MPRKYLALTGGVGGAKLGLGLSHLLGPDELAFIVNTGDDFEHFGLHIAPDLDTLTYALAGLSNPETGWGRAGESWNFIAAMRELGGEDWFNLGDKDLALHLSRTARLRRGETLTQATRDLSAALGIRHAIWPMSDAPVRTVVETPHGPLAFQHYFVRERCVPAVTGFHFAGATEATLNPGALAWLRDPALAGVIICPSNPFVSIDPILALPGLRKCLSELAVPVVAVSPIVAGLALKGPTAKMMQELAMPTTALAVASHYQGLLDGFIVDDQDSALLDPCADLEFAAIATQTVMITLNDKIELARTTLQFLDALTPR